MKLFNVVLGKNDKYNNDWHITKDQYDNDVVINESTSQRIKIGKYLVPTIDKKFEDVVNTDVGTDLVTMYDFSNDGHHVVNKKNLSIIMIKNSTKDTNDYSNEHLIYVTIPTEKTRIIDSNINLDCAEIINSYRSNGMLGAVIKIDTKEFPDAPLSGDVPASLYRDYVTNEVKIGEFILYNLDAKDENTRVIKKVLTIKRDLSSLSVTTFYVKNGYYKDMAEDVAESNFFKKLMITPSKKIRTSVYLVNQKLEGTIENVFADEDEVTILSVNPKIFKNGSEDDLASFDECMKTHILNNKVKAITVIGIKLPKEIYNKYRITTCFVHDIDSGIIRCVKC